MPNKPKRSEAASKQRQSPASGVISFIKRHKVLAILSIPVFLAALYVGWYQYTDYKQQFTKEQYEQLSAIGKSILGVTGQPVEELKTCSYESTEVYSSPRLYCGIRMVSYTQYVSDEQARSMARSFDELIGDYFNDKMLDFSRFYARPKNGIATVVVSLEPPYPKDQCNFTIQSNRAAQRVLDFPERNEDNLIALSFGCSSISRGEFYPVTNR